MKLRTGHLVIALLAVGFGGGVWLQARANSAARLKNRELQVQEAERRLSRENAAKAMAPHDEASALKGMEDAELRLRASIQNLRDRIIAEEIKTAGRNNAGRYQKAAENWRNAGCATPADTLNSVVWAAINGEVETLSSMLSFDEESRAALTASYAALSEPLRAQFSTPEDYYATIMSARMPFDLSGAEVVSQANEAPDRVAVRFRLHRGTGKRGIPREAVFRFQQAGSGWSLIVPKSAF